MAATLWWERRVFGHSHGSTKISQAITTIGLDIAKSGFYVHGIDVEGKVIGARPGQSRQEN
jgi:hypothetical protein